MNRIVDRAGVRVSLAFVAFAAVACGTDKASTAVGHRDRSTVVTHSATSASTSTVLTTTSTTTVPSTTPTAPSTSRAPAVRPPAPAAAPTNGLVSMVTAAQLGGSWHAGCPVGPSQLRLLTLPYWGFDEQAHQGQLIVNVSVVSAVTTVFSRLFSARFPIRKMVTIEHYPGTGVTLDDESLADDNTAAFNCRNAVSPGAAPSWSVHAYGQAIDVNPVENPYVESNGVVDPTNGAAYVDRSNHRPGMAFVGSDLNAAFSAVGWGWGGNFAGHPDYQHFSVNGR